MKIEIIIDDRIISFLKRIATRRNIIIGFFFAVLAASALLFAGVPHTFSPGEVISAQKMNENFAAVTPAPPGAVVAFMGLKSNIPSGWLLCNGREVDRSAYPDLYAAIGTLYGPGNGSTTFNIPDLRGLFLRGINDGRVDAYRDEDAASRVDYAGTVTGDRVGTFQQDELQSHNHGYNAGVGRGCADDAADYFHAFWDWMVQYTSTDTGGTETRPKNAAVNYIIKY